MRYQLDMEQKYREGLEAGRAEGIAQEQKNTEAERRRAETAETRAETAETRAETAEKELAIALAEIERLKGVQGK